MKPFLLTVAPLALLAGSQAGAADFTDIAPVVSTTPIYERIAETRQDCAPIAAAPQAERSVMAPIIGGVAGAIIGSQVGGGRGRDAAAAVGAVVGAVAGDRIANPDSETSIAGAAVGGAAGAVLGNQVGGGSGRTVATAAGAVAGAAVGDRVVRGQDGRTFGDRTCRTVDAGYREVVRGYTVVYRYNGRDITTTLPYDPGRSVRVAVGVIDAEQPRADYGRHRGNEGGVYSGGAARSYEQRGDQRRASGGYQYRY